MPHRTKHLGFAAGVGVLWNSTKRARRPLRLPRPQPQRPGSVLEQCTRVEHVGRENQHTHIEGIFAMNSTRPGVRPGVRPGTHSGDALPVSNLRELTMTPVAADDLIHSAQRSLARAALASTPHERYAAAHLAALRAAAAVIAVVASRSSQVRANRPVRQQVRSAWVVLREVCPPLSEWADFFAAGAQTRAAAEAGIPCVGARAADDLVRDAQTFLARVCDVLELAHQPALDLRLRAVG